ncbi:MAG: insulinase family protein, partial [Elusimicrobia bacterium]|nr:insulinase family protein [Elusimicrobiota bacterium]
LAGLIWLGGMAALGAEPPRLPEPVPVPLSGDPMQATVHRLANGLTVYLSPNPLEPRVSARIVVRAGSKQDPPDSTGMAHYLEHMLFKGSRSLGTLDYAKEEKHLKEISRLYDELFLASSTAAREAIYVRIDAESVQLSSYAVPNEIDRLYNEKGFQGVNAFTTEENTVYVCNFPANRAELWARVEADRFAHPVFRLFQSEIEAVFEEKNRSMDNAARILDEALERQLYKVHPYGQYTVLGSTEHLKNPSLSKMYSFFDAYYRPNNMALVLSGDFRREEMLRLIEKHFGNWRPAADIPRREWPVPVPRGAERVEVRYEAEEQATIAWLTAPRSSPDADALAVMDMVIDNAAAGLLNLELNQAQKVKESGSYPRLLNDAGAWYVWAVPKKGQSLEEAQRLLLETVEHLKTGRFTEEDVRAIITDFEVDAKKKLESNDSRAALMEESFAGREEWAFTAARLDRLRRVTKQDVLRVARRYLGPDRVIAYRREGRPSLQPISKPKFTKIALDPDRRSPFFEELRRLEARPLAPRWLQAGRDYEVRELPWGKLYWTRNPLNDLFSISFEFDRGWRHDRLLCEAVSLLGLSGAAGLSAEDFKKRLYALGASMETSCGEQESSVRLSGLDANFEKSLELLLSRLSSPRPAPGTLARMIGVRVGAHRDQKKDPGFMHRALGEFAMRGSESAALNDLSDAELEGMKESKLLELIRSIFAYRRSALYAGPRLPASLEKALSAGGPPYRTAPARVPRRYVKPAAARILLTHRDMVQSRVGLFAADEAFDPDKVVDYQFYNEYMGGMSGVIFQEVRETRALAYSASGSYKPGARREDESLLVGAAGCQADKTIETAALMGSLLGKMPVSAERFRLARRALEEAYRSDVVTFRQIPGTLLAWEWQGISGGDPRPARFQKVLQYSQKDIEGFARRFQDKPLTVYMLGNRERIDLPGLRVVGTLEEKTIDELVPY